jgi:uncharacterized repeat protein (TIGR03843 family)
MTDASAASRPRRERARPGRSTRPFRPADAAGATAFGDGPASARGGGHAGDGAGTPGDEARHRDEAATLELLAAGTLEVKGRLVDASNATMYCSVSGTGPGGVHTEAACVYKPVAGERPLWDFPEGTLAGRELAAYVVSRAGGWDVVPPTVYRDGPFGPGMCQLWIDADTAVDVVELARSSDDARLRQMAVFDAVVNNADRKIGHLLPDVGGRLYGCDHGVCFGAEYKLRTVLWQWRGKKLRPEATAALGRLRDLLEHGDLAAELGGWLSATEVAATARRVEMLLEHGVHPYPPADWPAVPWPPI